MVFILFVAFTSVATAQNSAIEIRSKTADVQVFVDNEPKGQTSFNEIVGMHYLRVPIPAGFYQLRCEAAGFAPFIQQVEVPSTGARVVTVEFLGVRDHAESIRPAEGQAVSLTGKIKVLSEPSGASIDVNRQRQTVTTDAIITSQVGEKIVRVYFSSRSLDAPPFFLDAGEEVTINANFLTNTITIDKKVILHLSSKPDGATLTLDGKAIGTLPQSLNLEIRNRPYEAIIRLDGHEQSTLQLQPKANDLQEVTLRPLIRSVTISSNPNGAIVYLLKDADRTPLGNTPLTYTIPEPGTYRFVAEKDDFFRYVADPQPVVFGINDATRQLTFSLTPSNAVMVRIRPDPVYTPSEQLNIGGRNLGLLTQQSSVSVPAGRQTIRIGFWQGSFEFESGRSYTLTPLLPMPPNALQSMLSSSDLPSLPGYRSPPTEPKYLPESRSKYTSVPSLFDTGGLAGFGLSFWPGVLLGGLVATENTDAGMSVVIGTWIAGWLIGALIEPKQVYSGEEQLPDNIQANTRSKDAWKNELSVVQRHNQQLLDQENARRRQANEAFTATNRNRGYLSLLDDRNQENRVNLNQITPR
jgi:hypothetical protein